jgi:hypothetical protein
MMPTARVVRGEDIGAPERGSSTPGRGRRIFALLILVPLVGLPLGAVVVFVAREAKAMLAGEKPERIDPVVMLEGTALANSLRAELGSADISVARFVDEVSVAKLAAVVPGDPPCNREELTRSGVADGVRVSAPHEQVDSRSLAEVAGNAASTIATFEAAPTAWHLRQLQDIALKLHTVVFVVAVKTSATIRPGDGTFEPGTLRGTGYVYSAREHRIRCAGAIEVTNGDKVRYQYRSDYFDGSSRRASAERALADDLDDQLVMAVESSLRVTAAR